MASIFGIVLIFLIVFSCLKGINQVGRVGEQMLEGFETDRQLAICANLLALEANLRSAQQFWQAQTCFESKVEIDRLALDIGQVLETWQDRYPEVDPAHCELVGRLGLQTHLEKNPELSPEYPNWTVHYHEVSLEKPHA